MKREGLFRIGNSPS